MKFQPIFLDLCPAYIPFMVQATKADGDKADPSADALIIYEEGGADATFDSTTITGSPFDPAKVNSKTGLWGVLIDKTRFTAGKFYVALWELTVDSKTTAKVEIFFATNASAFKADVSEITGIISNSKIAAQVKGIDDIDFSATMKASINAEVDSALNTAIPAEPAAGSINEAIAELDALVSQNAIAARITGIEDIDFTETMLASLETAGINALNTASPATITATSAFDRLDDIEGKIDDVQGSGFEEANDNLHTLRNRFDDTFGNLGVENIPSIDGIVAELERAGGTLDSIKTTVDVNLDARVSTRNTLGTGTQEVTYTLLVAGTTDPIAGALVEARIENNSQAAVVVSGYTNIQGKITFMLDPGTYYLWRSKANYVFTNPNTLIVEGDNE